jgi:hypothetical protein
MQTEKQEQRKELTGELLRNYPAPVIFSLAMPNSFENARKTRENT